MYFLTRFLVFALLATPTALFFEGKLELGHLFILIGLALIFVELADISEAIKKSSA